MNKAYNATRDGQMAMAHDAASRAPAFHMNKTMSTIKTTAKYPLTRSDCEKQIAGSIEKFGSNQAKASFGYRKNGVPGTGGGTIAYSFVESPRTPGAFREIGYCS